MYKQFYNRLSTTMAAGPSSVSAAAATHPRVPLATRTTTRAARSYTNVTSQRQGALLQPHRPVAPAAYRASTLQHHSTYLHFSPLKQNRAAFFASSARIAAAAPALAERSAGGTYVSEDILENVPLVDVKKVLVVGSGGLSIGQAGEFDYSGSQAIKALRESGVETILINPNIATIQTSHALADTVYFLPVTPEYLVHILERERPDGILLTFGGQTALNCGIRLDKMGVLDRLAVKVLGTPIKTLILSEDRDLFAKALKGMCLRFLKGENKGGSNQRKAVQTKERRFCESYIDIPVAQSTAVESVDGALAAANEIGYPVIVRSAFSLGGLGSGFANNPAELHSLATKSLSLAPQLLVERSMKGWKEVEYEVVRDAANNCITVCNMENFDPLGIHTGDSIVVAPSQTLSDEEYHMLRTAAIKIVRHMGVVGECNVQYALNPNSLEYMVIEMNARLSRSSALASKATGYPLAFIAAKIALGHTLPNLTNTVTKTTTACFEPSLDYIVTKIPRWDLSKFQYVDRHVGSSMKSVGEVMAIGRTFEESLQKAIRQVDPSFQGFHGLPAPFKDVDDVLSDPTDRRLFALGQTMLSDDPEIRRKYTVDKLHELTKIDKWFLYKLENIAEVHRALKDRASKAIPTDLLHKAKKTGFSDIQIAKLTGGAEDAVRKARKEAGIVPFVKRIDTLAAEFPAHTNYLYTTYNASEDDVTFDDQGTMVLGSGVYRIGSSVEFDWCGVSCIRALRELGKKTVMVNYNPETVSTDFDECDRLYFEELSFERVMDIYEKEQAEGVVVSVGGQLPQNIALRLSQNEVNVLGTDPKMIDSAEDRYKFSRILDRIGVDQPAWKELTSVEEAYKFADQVGYPVLVRPSYVLSGAAMNVAYTPEVLKHNLTQAADVSPLHPVVITKFIQDAQEIDVDAVAHQGKLLVHAVSEHVENAGVHSGDATLVLPPGDLDKETMARLKGIAEKVASAFEITGPFNMQIIKKSDPGQPSELKVIECNLRASRSFPFVSKVLGTNFIDVATRALANTNVPAAQDLMAKDYAYQAVKVPQFSWTRLQGADPFLGVEMASTGEVACFGVDKEEAFWSAIQSTQNFRIPKRGAGVLLGHDSVTNEDDLIYIARRLHADLGHTIFTHNPDASRFLQKAGVPSTTLPISANHSDKKALQALFLDNQIDFVIHLAKVRAPGPEDDSYVVRRSAVDFGIPLVNDAKVGRLFVDACVRKRVDVKPPQGVIPSEVKSWSEFVGVKI
ncbi:large subunit of carbamoyl-phosphate synthase [Jimgerdemannia flammicorona]|uniref:Ammonium-dependent carbamoyl phosphate synthetase n=1 Tax=Jimgerdemannia flammicorona TaxID=994334 RepID=A0A433D1H3_9FUNG|nr:large subunit of carbamoyl-phosphate synthase [Jimgerdemannia flammicorona]